MSIPEPARIPMGPVATLQSQLALTGEPQAVRQTLLRQVAQTLGGRVVSTQDIALVVHRVLRDAELSQEEREELARHAPTWIRAITPFERQEEAIRAWEAMNLQAALTQQTTDRNERLRRVSWGCLIAAIVAEIAYVTAVAATAESFGVVSRSFFVLFAASVLSMATAESVCELRSSVKHLAWVCVMATLAAVVFVLAFVH